MSINYTWSFPNFETDADNKVKVIHWRYTATDSETDAENNAYVSSMYGSCAGSDGMDFNTMTQEHCKNCVLENEDKTEDEMQSNLSAQIEKQKNPETISKTKEW